MFEKIEMTADAARKYIVGSIGSDGEARENLIDAVKTWANCHEADVSTEGNIWIAQPQAGHWLSDDHLVKFINWNEKQ